MIVRLTDVELAYGRDWSLSGIDLEIPRGDFLAIVGPNGSGKTTILRAILGIHSPKRGEIWWDKGRRFGYVPQRQYIDEIYPLTAFDVALMGRYSLIGPLSRPSRKDRDVTLESLDHVGVRELADRAYRNLSGGQKQRVLIARALAGEPDVLVLDEPTNDMDISSEASTMRLISHLHEAHKMTVIMVSHLLNVVADYARTIVLLSEGKLITGPAEQVLSTDSLRSVYSEPVDVLHVSGRRVIVAGGNND
ncbi:MAG: ABC transporter ATP-binding protein [Armatimonadetes bacterium]|nr:ABC transporter ATP-binding protein [Armatimonadota bacterium]